MKIVTMHDVHGRLWQGCSLVVALVVPHFLGLRMLVVM
jgi:hypothetical protein